jgi:competence protein ComEA
MWGGEAMRKVDESAEQAANLRRRRKILGFVAAGLILVCGVGWWQKTSPSADATLVSRSGNAEAARRTPKEIVVYVSGMVGHPGVLKVNAGARAIDVVNAAGGLLQGADVTKINLAQTVKDGMQIHIPGRPQESSALAIRYPSDPRVQAAAKSSPQQEKVNINTAGAAELDKLPGVGPALAGRIIEYRNANGLFKDGEELKKVKGLGESKYEKLKDKIVW